jgi:hypothetical protein
MLLGSLAFDLEATVVVVVGLACIGLEEDRRN